MYFFIVRIALLTHFIASSGIHTCTIEQNGGVVELKEFICNTYIIRNGMNGEYSVIGVDEDNINNFQYAEDDENYGENCTINLTFIDCDFTHQYKWKSNKDDIEYFFIGKTGQENKYRNKISCTFIRSSVRKFSNYKSLNSNSYFYKVESLKKVLFEDCLINLTLITEDGIRNTYYDSLGTIKANFIEFSHCKFVGKWSQDQGVIVLSYSISNNLRLFDIKIIDCEFDFDSDIKTTKNFIEAKSLVQNQLNKKAQAKINITRLSIGNYWREKPMEVIYTDQANIDYNVITAVTEDIQIDLMMCNLDNEDKCFIFGFNNSYTPTNNTKESVNNPEENPSNNDPSNSDPSNNDISDRKKKENNNNKATIIVGVVLTIVIIALIIVIVLLLIKKKKNDSQSVSTKSSVNL